MSIQSSVNQAFSAATWIYSQTPQAKAFVENKRLQEQYDVAVKGHDLAAKPITEKNNTTEEEFAIYQNALDTEEAAARELYQSNPTAQTHKQYVESAEFAQSQRDAAEMDRVNRENARMAAARKAEEDRKAAEDEARKNAEREKLRRRIMRGGLDD